MKPIARSPLPAPPQPIAGAAAALAALRKFGILPSMLPGNSPSMAKSRRHQAARW